MATISGLPFIRNFMYRYYSVATTSSSGAPTSQVVVASRCKYIGGWVAPNNAVTISSTGTQGTDVVAFIGNSATATVISSGTSITTTTGTQGTPISVTSTAAVFLNPGDIIATLGSTFPGGFVTHIVQEF